MLSSERVSELLQVQLGPLYWIWQTGAGCAGIVSIIAGFVMLYLTMPNTRVRFSAALAGGLVAGVAWYATQRLILAGTIVSVAKYGAIYGTFATIMVFLFWVYLNWVIVLAGAMFSFAVQNHDNDEVIFESQRLPFGTAQAMGLLVTWEICSAAATGAPPWTARDFARRQRLSMKVVHDLLGVLTRAGLVAEVAAHPGGYLPARDAGILTPADVELAFRADSPDDDPVAMPATAPVLALFEERFGGFTAALRQTSFRDLLATPPAAPKTEA